MLVLVTGARGFIGKHFVSQLIVKGHAVRACSRERVDGALSPGIEHCQIDLLDGADKWRPALEGVHAVVHLAAQVHVMGKYGAELRRSFDEVNAAATRRLAEHAQVTGVKRFVFVSSVKVHGETSGTKPFRSDDVPRPLDAYGLSKLKAEEQLKAVTIHGRGMDHVIVRPTLVYGPEVRANFRRLLSLVYLGIPLPFAGIENRRSLANVWNVADLLVRCVEHERVPEEPVLVADEGSLSTPRLLQAIAKAMGKRARLFRVPAGWLDLAATIAGRREELARLTENLEVDAYVARRALGWQPPVTTDLALERTVSWYLEQRAR